MKNIYTHMHVDADAALSAAFVRAFVPGFEDAGVVFVPAFWDGTEGRNGDLPVMEDGDIAVDIPAGGNGIKGVTDADGTVHSALSSLVQEYCTDEQQAAFARLVDFVDSSDAGQRAWDDDVVALPQVIAAIKEANGRNGDAAAVAFAETFLQGHLRIEASRLRAAAEADKADKFQVGKAHVAVVKGAKERGTNAELYSRGFHAVVYVDGNNLGATRPPTFNFRLDTEAVKEVVNAEDGWFYHPAGFLAARGSFKSPAESPSEVDPHALARAVATTIAEQL